MSFLKELRRRNVFRVGAAYIIIAWLIAQVLQLTFESFGTPDWVIKTVLVLLATGLPFSLFFAWAFEMTPEGIKREHEVDRTQSITPHTGKKLDRMIIGILALSLAYFAYDKFVLSTGRETVAIESAVEAASSRALTKQAAIEEAAAESRKSIAVLPFINMSDDASNEFFSDGLSEELLNLLAKIPELRERWGGRWPIEIAHVYAWVGDADEVFSWLEKELEINGLSGVMVDNFFTDLHDDRRWQPLLEKGGVSADQLAAIEFKVTLPN